VIIGTKLKELNNSNCRVGESNYLVIEADEYKESFLNYSPSIIVLTNIEKDHLDYYGNLDNILKAFEEYINSINPDGSLIVNRDDENIMKVLGRIDRKDLNIVFYSEKDEDFELIKKTLTLPGKHNVYNGTAVFKLSKILEISEDSVLKSLADFSGSWRRMDIKEISINGKRVTLINDYAHHPTEVRVTLEAMKEKYPDRNVWCVFQPHQYQRTDLLFDNFIKVIQEAVDMNYVNRLSLIDIYDVAGRENLESKARVNSSKLVESVNRKNVEYISKDSILEIISKDIKENDVLILMGAGNIYNLNKKIY
jgi:UDP-N-acetylmuramate--alanine ligase